MHDHPWWMLLAGAVGMLSCRVPDTLGLVCGHNDHCDNGQYCSDEGVCAAGPRDPDSGGLPPPQPPPPMPPPPTGGGTTSADVTTDGTADSTSGAVDPGTSTGEACGLAVGSCDAVDVLFVVDNSGSMGDDNAQLIPAFANLQDLVGELIDGPCTYRIGVTTTEPAPDFQPGSCQVRGALSRAGAICADPFGDPEHPPWISEEDDVTTLGCLFAVGTNYTTNEQQFQTILDALGPELQGPGGCNEGFMREGVPLLIVLITDEDDDDDSADPSESPERTGSPNGPGQWWNDLTALKDPSELGMVVVSSTNPAGCEWSPSSGSSDGTGAEYAERILTFLQFFTGAGYGDHFRTAELCQPAADLLREVAVLDQVLVDVCADVGR